jgi:hypothetical protein
MAAEITNRALPIERDFYLRSAISRASGAIPMGGGDARTGRPEWAATASTT